MKNKEILIEFKENDMAKDAIVSSNTVYFSEQDVLRLMDQAVHQEIDLSPTNSALVIKVGDRFFNDYKNKRIKTAWSLAGAKKFLPNHKREEFQKAIKKLQEKNYKPEIKTIIITE